jgi:hypothetical protein
MIISLVICSEKNLLLTCYISMCLKDQLHMYVVYM